LEEFEEVEEGQVSKDDFMQRFQKKAVQKVKAKVLGKKHIEEEETDFPEEYEEPDMAQAQGQKMSMQDMKAGELAMQEQQFMEYKQHESKPIVSEVELDNGLTTIESRSSTKRELIKALKTPDGKVRNVAIYLEEDYPELFSEDLTKGNFGDREVESVWGNGALCNYLKAIGQARGTDLKPAYRFFKMNFDLYSNISRSKGGFAAILRKTDKHVSEGVVEHVQKSLEVKKKKTWGWF